MICSAMVSSVGAVADNSSKIPWVLAPSYRPRLLIWVFAHLFSLMRLRAILAHRIANLGDADALRPNAEVTIVTDASFAGSARRHWCVRVRNNFAEHTKHGVENV